MFRLKGILDFMGFSNFILHIHIHIIINWGV